MKDDVDRLVGELKQIRDELRVRVHLAKADAKDEWAQLEKKWEHVRARAERVGDVAEDAAEEVGDAISKLGNELKKGYERVRNML
jgi:hypothetical protein